MMFNICQAGRPSNLRCGPLLLAMALAVPVTGCSSFGADGPSSSAIAESPGRPVGDAAIAIVSLTDAVARELRRGPPQQTFSEKFSETEVAGARIGNGDILDITLWEAPPGVLFGSAQNSASGLVLSSQTLSQPGQTVDTSGRINVPFAGSVQAAGRTPAQIEREIVSRLQGKAHQPQASIRVARNNATAANVVGDVVTSGRVPLTPKGERLLDVLAIAGGAKHPVSKTMIQISRGERVASMPLETVIADHRQNIIVQPDDVVAVQFQPFSFTALGATGNNSEHPFEATGITLAQALGRVGGLRDDRADIRGVFLFRFEDPARLGPHRPAEARLTPDGKLPVIYRLDLKDPASLFTAQNFAIRNKDVLYVSDAPLADLQKFMNMLSSATFSLIGVANAIDSDRQ